MLKKVKEGLANRIDGRKYRLALICLLVLLGGFAMTCLNPAFVKAYVELVGGVLGIYFVYCGGNVGKAWAIGRKDGLIIRSGDAGAENGTVSSGKRSDTQ